MDKLIHISCFKIFGYLQCTVRSRRVRETFLDEFRSGDSEILIVTNVWGRGFIVHLMILSLEYYNA